jgi:hypothetical protein
LIIIIELVINLGLGFLISFYVFLILDLDHCFFESASIRFKLPKLVQIFVSVSILQTFTSLRDVMEHNILILHQVTALWPQDSISCSCQYILHRHFLKHFAIEVAFNNETTKLALLKTLFENILFNCINRD